MPDFIDADQLFKDYTFESMVIDLHRNELIYHIPYPHIL